MTEGKFWLGMFFMCTFQSWKGEKSQFWGPQIFKLLRTVGTSMKTEIRQRALDISQLKNHYKRTTCKTFP